MAINVFTWIITTKRVHLFSSLAQFSMIASFCVFLQKIRGASHNFFSFIYIYIYKIEIRNSKIYLPKVSVSSTMKIWWDSGQIQIITAQWLMGPSPGKHVEDVRFGKSTHISKISNSVTHLQSYTNSAIADITGNSAPISPVTPRDRRRRLAERRRLRIERRRLRIESRYRHIEWPMRGRRRCCPKRRRLHIERRRLLIERRYRCIEWRLFHDVSQKFKCFMMFY